MAAKADWRALLDAGRLQPHRTSRDELRHLRAVVDRDLRDAAIEELSSDRRFATAYNAALQLAKMILAAEGYRVTGAGHHATTWEALEIALGSAISALSVYFDSCRRMRNKLDYDFAEVASESEAEDLLARVLEFRKIAEKRIKTKRHR